MGRGRLIAFEGLDNSGKTTQVEKLGKRLNGKIEKFPNRASKIGQIINDHLTKRKVIQSLKTEHLLMAANRAERETEIIQNLKDGFDVLADRFYASGVAYTSAKEIDGTLFQTNDELYNWAKLADQHIIEPDITFYFTSEIDFEQTDDHMNREIYENDAFQKKVKGQFERIKNEKQNWVEIKVDMYRNKIQELNDVLFKIIKEQGEMEGAIRFNSF